MLEDFSSLKIRINKTESKLGMGAISDIILWSEVSIITKTVCFEIDEVNDFELNISKILNKMIQIDSINSSYVYRL